MSLSARIIFKRFTKNKDKNREGYCPAIKHVGGGIVVRAMCFPRSLYPTPDHVGEIIKKEAELRMILENSYLTLRSSKQELILLIKFEGESMEYSDLPNVDSWFTLKKTNIRICYETVKPESIV